ncbi:hypothetical protein OG799_17695 [Micromonospora sp. NBC_00898]|uniref:hypothetical protein n=1 Tax=Micromonospora sp. NBC_00898 TaxID=2975981 RepID=UPI00386B5805|nr:hypothetical protein OG799_17695 [Micromonospora sp. NBC_00898]
MADTRRTLARLGESHLVVERSAGRYVLHDLLLEYAGELDLDHAGVEDMNARSAASRLV